MSAERWIEIGDCAIIKTEDLIQLPGRRSNLWTRKRQIVGLIGEERGGGQTHAVFILVLALISRRGKETEAILSF